MSAAGARVKSFKTCPKVAQLDIKPSSLATTNIIF